MPIVRRNDIDPGLLASVSFIAAQNDHTARQQAAADEEARRRQEAAEQLLQQLAQGAMQQPQAPQPPQPPPGMAMPGTPGAPPVHPGPPPGPGQGPAAPAGPAGPAPISDRDATQRYLADRQAGSRLGAAGAAFLGHQAAAGAATAAAGLRAGAQLAGQQATADRQLATARIGLQKQQQSALAAQQLAEMNKALDQRNRLMRTAPGILDPAQISETQARINANLDALSFPARQARQKLMERIAIGDPQAIQEGVAQGVLAFTPEQQTRLRQLKEAFAQVRIDPRLSPSQMAIAERNLAEKINAIRPMEVPPSERQLTPEEQYRKDTIHDVDQVSGLPVKYHYKMRNGSMERIMDDDSKVHLDNWAKKDLAKWEMDNGKHHEEAKTKAFERDLQSWKAGEPEPPKEARFKKKGPEDEGGKAVTDWDAYGKALKEHEAKVAEWEKRKPTTEKEQLDTGISEMQQGLATGMGMMPMPGSDTTGFEQEFPDDSPPPSEADTDYGAAFGGDAAALEDQTAPPTPPVLSPHDDGVSEWDAANVGDVVTLPDGRIVEKTGPTSFRPVH